jgi:hypothetical protein
MSDGRAVTLNQQENTHFYIERGMRIMGFLLKRKSYKQLKRVEYVSDRMSHLIRPYIDEIIEDHQCGFRHNRSSADQIFCICQILEIKWEYYESVHQLFIGFKKAYDSVRRDVLYNVVIEFGVPMKLVRLIKLCLSETYSKVCIGKHFSDSFPIQNCLKKGDNLSPLLLKFALECVIRKPGGTETKWYTSDSGLR